MNVLVTGSNGLIGRHLVEFLLYKNIRVIGFDITLPEKRFSQSHHFTFEQGNVDDFSRVVSVIKKYKIDRIIHGGGISHPKESEEFPNKIINANIVGTSNVFEAGRLSKVKQIVYLSSAAVYGNRKTINFTESAVPEPNTIYGVTKLTGEHLAKVYYEKYGINTTSFRIPFVYGPGRATHDPIKFILEKALNGENIIEETGMDQRLEYIYVKDVVDAIWLTLNSKNANGLILNIGTEKLKSTREIIDVMEKLFPNIVFDLGSGGFGYDETSPLDCTKAKEVLNFISSYSIVEGINEYYDFLKR
ncbi:NAD-dependent epimerase/dehydratase family protein [Oceanobacillus timonensis]|uniref:NAD-dependent epimerase/dehydratase family protein n=1 Tax=Oceanobacillus timonensis TaxID=1926285 RepID=UPI0009BBDE44|nr:NAD(P)-dependent oxidoreductase [Oceanobacillus timonensis]